MPNQTEALETFASEIKKLNTDKQKRNGTQKQMTPYSERYHLITENSFEWIWEVDENGVYTFAGGTVENVLGYKPEELIGKTPFDFMSRDEAERVKEIFFEIASRQEPFSKLLNTCLHKNGTKVHTETSGQPFYDEEGFFRGYRGIDFDRSEEINNTRNLEIKALALKNALHTQHQILLNVTNSIADLLFYKDPDFRYIGCNSAFSDFLGLPMDFIIGKTDFELFPKNYAKLSRSKDINILKNLETQSDYAWAIHADGRRLYFLTQKSPLIDETGTLIGLVGISRDVTHEQHLEKELQSANRQLLDAQSIAKVGHWDWNIQTNSLFWSDEIYRIFGFKPQEFGATYDAFLQTIHPDDRQSVEDAVAVALQTKSRYSIFHRVVCADDASQKIVHEMGHALYDDKGNPIQMIGTVQDVTEFKMIEKKLQEQKEAFETIFEHTHDAMLIFDNNKITECNQMVVKMMRAANKEDILNRHSSEFSPPFQPDGQASDEKAKMLMAQCFEKGFSQFEWVYLTVDGEPFLVDVLLTKLRINNKLVIQGAWRDISEHKALENSLIESNTKYSALINELDERVEKQSAQLIKQSRLAQMGELLSMIAHQWRQPLSSISAVASHIKLKLALSQEKSSTEITADYLNQKMQEIETYIQSLSNTIDDFRNLYNPNKLMSYHPINEPIEHALSLMSISIAKYSIILEKSYESKISTPMQSNEIMQVLLNIFKNAKDCLIEKNINSPKFIIRTSHTESYAKIEICDNAGGVDAAVIEKIFDPYFSTKDEKNGTGLGLYMSKTIIEQQHHGKLSVRNENGGACFSIELPLFEITDA